MSVYIYITAKQEDIDRFWEEIMLPEIHRLYETKLFPDDRSYNHQGCLFKLTENEGVYRERNKETHVVERFFRGYSPAIYSKDPKFCGRYTVDNIIKRKDVVKMTEVQTKIHLRANFPSELKLFYDEVIETNRDRFCIDKDTGIYINPRGYSSRIFGGHFLKLSNN